MDTDMSVKFKPCFHCDCLPGNAGFRPEQSRADSAGLGLGSRLDSEGLGSDIGSDYSSLFFGWRYRPFSIVVLLRDQIPRTPLHLHSTPSDAFLSFLGHFYKCLGGLILLTLLLLPTFLQLTAWSLAGDCGLWRAGLAAGMMAAAAAAGMGVAAEFSSSVAKASLLGSQSLVGSVMQRPLPFLATNFGCSRSTPSRLLCLAPSALYYPCKVSNSSPYRCSGYFQLGLSVWQGAGTRHVQQVVARAKSGNDLETWVRETNSREPVVVYSKSWCPYCMRVKKLLGSLGYDIEVIELDEDGEPGLQEALETVSGQYTVPIVYIGGKRIGGCDDTVALHSRGQLEPLLQAVGANKK